MTYCSDASLKMLQADLCKQNAISRTVLLSNYCHYYKLLLQKNFVFLLFTSPVSKTIFCETKQKMKLKYKLLKYNSSKKKLSNLLSTSLWRQPFQLVDSLYIRLAIWEKQLLQSENWWLASQIKAYPYRVASSSLKEYSWNESTIN